MEHKYFEVVKEVIYIVLCSGVCREHLLKERFVPVSIRSNSFLVVKQ
jgi:hypothetical protein